MTSMALSGEHARFILTAKKRLVAFSGWKAAENRGPCAVPVTFVARIAIEGSLPRGVFFRIVTIPQYPNGGTFQLDCEQPDVRARLPLYRLEWRPPASHRNGPYGPPELRGLFIDAGTTHVHSCLDHIDDATDTVRPGGCQAARIVEDFATYDEALRWACTSLNIVNHGDIPPPPLQGEMQF